MSTKLNVWVIWVWNMWLNHVRTLFEIDQVNLIAISEINEELGNNVSQKYWCKHYTNYEDMIKSEKLDLISVVVPTKFHFPICKHILEKWINVLLEKPITHSIEEWRRLIELAKSKWLKLLVWHIERHNPSVIKVKEMIDSWEIGDLTALTFQRVGGLPPQIKDSNIIVDLAIHDIDISNYLVWQNPSEYYSHKKRNHLEQREDSVEIFMRYPSVSSYIQCNWISPIKIRKLTVTWTNWIIEMDYISQKIVFYKSNYDKFKENSSNYTDYLMKFSEPDKIEISVWKKEPLKQELLFLIDCILNNKDCDSSFAIEALDIALHC